MYQPVVKMELEFVRVRVHLFILFYIDILFFDRWTDYKCSHDLKMCLSIF